MLMWLETVWKSMPRINFITSKAVSFGWITPKCVSFFASVSWSFGSFDSEKSPTCSFPRHLGCPQDEFRNQLLTAVLFAEQLPLCELPPEPEIEDLSATRLYHLGRVGGNFFLGAKLRRCFTESFEATSLPGLFFRSFSITYMFKKNKNSGTVRSQLERSWDFPHPTFGGKIPGQSRRLRGRDYLRGRCWRNASSAETLIDAG